MKFLFFLFTFFIGIVLGTTAILKYPELVLPYVPESIKGNSITLEGMVMKKEFDQQSLRITMNTDQGALVATLTNKLKETNLLINEGDAVTLVLDAYQPFMKNPKISQVKKPHSMEKESLPPLSPSDVISPFPSLPERELPEAIREEKRMNEAEIEEELPQ